MGPKKGGNAKAVAAKERKAEAKGKEKLEKEKAAEDAAWAAAGEGAKSKSQAKKEEQAKQREEAAAKKAEAKRMAAEEDAALSAQKNKSKAATPKVTSHQLQLEKEARQRELQKEKEERQREQKKMVSEEAYEQLVASPNMNKAEPDAVEARSVGEALSVLNVGGEVEEDRHPERRAKAAFEAYQQRELPVLKEGKPGLKQSQYKDMLWKSWQKAPENPMNTRQ